MKKSTLAALLMSSLLAGCSDSSSTGSGSNTGASKTYQWQIAHLESVDEDDLDNKCVIYATSTEETENSTVDEPEYQVITAYKADEDYNIIYHNADGSIAQTMGSDEISDGLFTISANDVPDNGYVTLEELSGDLRDGNLGSFMFSVQKSLLTDLVLNNPQAQTGTDCINGDDQRENEAVEKFVNITQTIGAIDYYQSSYDIDSIDGNEIAGIISIDYIEDETRDVLITGFDDFDTTSEDRTNLLGWKFIPSDQLFEALLDSDGNLDFDENGDIQYVGDGLGETTTLDNNDLTDITWSGLGAETITLNDESGVIVLHEDTTYLWQPIYDESTKLTIDYDTNEVDAWSSYFSGSVTLIDGDWDFMNFNSLSEEPTSINIMDFSTLQSLNSTTISNSCTDVEDGDGIMTTPDFCVDLRSNFDSDDFTYQRFHIRLQEVDGDDTQTTYQTIISPVNSEPVVLEANNINLDTSSIPTLLRVELNLMKTDDNDLDAVQYLMSQNMDLVSVGLYGSVISNDAETNFYTDLDGYISTEAETEALYQAVLKTNTTIVQSVYEAP